MPKRKSAEAGAISAPSLASLDAALDLLACEMFGRLESLAAKFEAAAGVKLNEGVVMRRWEDASKRYWVMKSMDDLSCTGGKDKPSGAEAEEPGRMALDDGNQANAIDASHRGKQSVQGHC